MFGDSITASSSLGQGDRIPAVVHEVLTRGTKGLAEWDVVNEGRGRETLEGAIKRLDGILARQDPDWVSVAYGLVDCAERDPGRFGDNLNRFIDQILARKPKTQIVLITTVPIDEFRHSYGKDGWFRARGGANHYINSEINGIIRRVALERNLPFIDLFRFLRDQPEWNSAISRDGIHPDRLGSRLSGEYIGQVLLAFWSSHFENDVGAKRAEQEALSLMTRAAALFRTLDAGSIREGTVLEEKAWRMCPYRPEIMNPFLVLVWTR